MVVIGVCHEISLAPRPPRPSRCLRPPGRDADMRRATNHDAKSNSEHRPLARSRGIMPNRAQIQQSGVEVDIDEVPRRPDHGASLALSSKRICHGSRR